MTKRVNTVKVEIGLPPEVRDALAASAEANEMEMSAYLQQLLQKASGLTWEIRRRRAGVTKRKGADQS